MGSSASWTVVPRPVVISAGWRTTLDGAITFAPGVTWAALIDTLMPSLKRPVCPCPIHEVDEVVTAGHRVVSIAVEAHFR